MCAFTQSYGTTLTSTELNILYYKESLGHCNLMLQGWRWLHGNNDSHSSSAWISGEKCR